MDGVKRYVLGFAFDAWADEVVLIEKNKPERQKGLLNGVGGKVGDTIAAESSPEAMSREFFEETGVNIMAECWKEVATLSGEGFSMEIFAVIMDTTEVRTMEDEKVVVMDIDKVHRHNAIQNLEFLIPLAKLVLETDHPSVRIQEAL